MPGILLLRETGSATVSGVASGSCVGAGVDGGVGGGGGVGVGGGGSVCIVGFWWFLVVVMEVLLSWGVGVVGRSGVMQCCWWCWCCGLWLCW